MYTALSQGLFIQTRTWRRLVPVVTFGPRQNTSCVGGISVKHSGDVFEETYPPPCIMLSVPDASIPLSTLHSSPMAVEIRTIARGVFLGSSVSKRMRKQCHSPVETQTPSRFEYPASQAKALRTQCSVVTWVQGSVQVVV